MKFNRKMILTFAITLLTLGSISCQSSYGTWPNFGFYKDYTTLTKYHKTSSEFVTTIMGRQLEVKCPPGQVLSGFNLVVRDSKFAYEFKCLKHEAVGNKVQKIFNVETHIQLDPKKRFDNGTHALGRQDVACPVGYGIQSFYLEGSREKMRYNYTCVDVGVRNCGLQLTKNTAANWDYPVRYLFRQHVNLKNENFEFLRRFQLNVNGENYRYVYGFCVAAKAQPQPKAKFAKNNTGRPRNTDNKRILIKLETKVNHYGKK